MPIFEKHSSLEVWRDNYDGKKVFLEFVQSWFKNFVAIIKDKEREKRTFNEQRKEGERGKERERERERERTIEAEYE